MPKHVGNAACSAEGAAPCYRTLCTEAAALMGEHMDPEVSIHTPPLADYMIHLRADNWQEVGKLSFQFFSEAPIQLCMPRQIGVI